METASILLQIDRHALYDEVWSTPMTQLGVKYGVTGPEIKKRCVELQIPCPRAGYWSRLRHGYPSEKPPLPPTSIAGKPVAPTMKMDRPRKGRPRIDPISASTSQTSKETVSSPAASLKPDSERKWHPVVKKIRDNLLASVKQVALQKKRYDWEAAHPGRQYPYLDRVYGSWEYFCDGGQILAATHRKSPTRLSLSSYERGLAILDLVCHSAQQHGYSVSFTDQDARIALAKDGTRVEIRISEKLTAGFRQRKRSWDKKIEQVKTLTATGRLILYVDPQGGAEACVTEKPGSPLEQQIDKINQVIDAKHATSIAHVIEWAKRDREYAEAAERRRAEEKIRKEAEFHRKQEQERRDAFVAEAKDWAIAVLLRKYLAMLDDRTLDCDATSSDYIAWRTWAGDVANDLDPTNKRLKHV
ncbi:hypothetical protein [Paraburkholderia caribensis]|uniref:hypothetical protein n=1 Tax=Paraburkholderia caribensis TaxID=75105 RepID=UPI001D072E94|nr:hypothetical protein [Paraburkholderia caribensis]